MRGLEEELARRAPLDLTATPWRRGALKEGNLVMLTSVGAVFTVGAVLLRWAY